MASACLVNELLSSPMWCRWDVRSLILTRKSPLPLTRRANLFHWSVGKHFAFSVPFKQPKLILDKIKSQEKRKIPCILPHVSDRLTRDCAKSWQLPALGRRGCQHFSSPPLNRASMVALSQGAVSSRACPATLQRNLITQPATGTSLPTTYRVQVHF